MKISALGVLGAVLVLGASASAQVKQGGSGESRGPIAITSDHLESDDVVGEVLFTGSVVARQGSMTLTCDRLKVFYTLPPPGEGETGSSPLVAGAGSREIYRVEGFGHVKMVDGDHLAVGDHALYLAKEAPRRLILTGDARAWQGRDSVTGHRITYFLDEKRSVAESAPGQRVKTVVHEGGSNSQ